MVHLSDDNLFYDKELKILEKANRVRARTIKEKNLLDFASNDYLNIGSNKKILKKTISYIEKQTFFSPKSSSLINGYHNIHKKLEKKLCKLNGFENGIIVGSGFLANIAMFESLIRKGDLLIIDELYHASGIMSLKLCQGKTKKFSHNNDKQLQEIIQKNKKNFNRIIVAVEGIYSMSGDMANKNIYHICNQNNCILIVDEAHSAGIIGENLNGWFDFFNFQIKHNHIKMGTLSKTYGSYGAYILSSYKIIKYLENRAKPIIYSTALSLFDTKYGLEAIKYIKKNKQKLKDSIKQRQKIVKDILNIDIDGLIIPISSTSNKEVLKLQQDIANAGFDVGAIRQPTVLKPILRVIAKSQNIDYLKALLDTIVKLKVASKDRYDEE
ncbi:MAG: hypothetical protein B1H07_00170 [Campylobacteraceae bacterium 4484_166]|nr:MAG: hypothetical protein B1H07_00170 [Campylobacteraceae bacterium 4484_166]